MKHYLLLLHVTHSFFNYTKIHNRKLPAEPFLNVQFTGVKYIRTAAPWAPPPRLRARRPSPTEALHGDKRLSGSAPAPAPGPAGEQALSRFLTHSGLVHFLKCCSGLNGHLHFEKQYAPHSSWGN